MRRIKAGMAALDQWVDDRRDVPEVAAGKLWDQLATPMTMAEIMAPGVELERRRMTLKQESEQEQKRQRAEPPTHDQQGEERDAEIYDLVVVQKQKRKFVAKKYRVHVGTISRILARVRKRMREQRNRPARQSQQRRENRDD